MLKRILLITLALALTSAFPAYAGVYAKLFKVTGVDNNLVTLVDCAGNSWLYYGSDDIEVDDYYSAVMDDCDTEIVFDDLILSLRYERVDLIQRY